ncbi:MAG: ATP-binding cassette domain-containing protein [Candidatus Wildermuthbacteria bacterium]|nr:ATP-binding cassette domain-containing protein [Candidatus Wildermuthbacteria bacterium]
MATEPLIRFHQVTKLYPPDTVALEDIDVAIEEHEFLSLVGKSGAGKTTFLKLLLKEEEPTKGELLSRGKNLAGMEGNELLDYRRTIGAIFQDYKLLDSRTVYENVAYAMEVLGAPDDAIRRDVSEVLKVVNLLHKIDQFPFQLSNGEKQRVAIARALIHRPQIILADEPTGNLDPYHTRDIVRLLLKIHEFGTTVLLATHNKEIVNLLGRRVITLDDGKIIRDAQEGRYVI